MQKHQYSSALSWFFPLGSPALPLSARDHPCHAELHVQADEVADVLGYGSVLVLGASNEREICGRIDVDLNAVIAPHAATPSKND